jgi:hypothetical protein
MKFIIVLFLCLPACAQTWFGKVTKKPTPTSCAIGWTTAVPTIAHIQYGLTAGSYTHSNANSAQYLRSKTETISGLKPGTTYHFKIVAADSSHDWVHSLDFTCTTTKTTTANHSVKLNWQASRSSGVNGYEVYRSTISGGYYGLLGKVAGLTYTDQTVQPGVAYFYAVKAINTAGRLSSFSNQIRALIP